MRQDVHKIKLGLYRRLVVASILFSSLTGLTSITPDEANVPHKRMHRNGSRLIITGSPSYLDLNPKL
jgi:hypothetical protein